MLGSICSFSVLKYNVVYLTSSLIFIKPDNFVELNWTVDTMFNHESHALTFVIIFSPMSVCSPSICMSLTWIDVYAKNISVWFSAVVCICLKWSSCYQMAIKTMDCGSYTQLLVLLLLLQQQPDHNKICFLFWNIMCTHILMLSRRPVHCYDSHAVDL